MLSNQKTIKDIRKWAASQDDLFGTIVTDICEWNAARYDREYNGPLTTLLLDEELAETSKAEQDGDKVEVCDGLGDVFYVAVGALWKADNSQLAIRMELSRQLAFADFSSLSNLTASIVKFQASVVSGDSVNMLPEVAVAAFVSLAYTTGSGSKAISVIEAICASNNTKEVKRVASDVKANVNKGPGYFPPTDAIKAILASPTYDWPKLALEEAANSMCRKRKVGAVLVGANDRYSRGHNYNTAPGPCEDSEGNTKDSVMHAEVAAVRAWQKTHGPLKASAVYVTQPPCDACKRELRSVGISDAQIHVVTDFLKFDSNKLKYELIPPSATEALATVLTYGAKKYKPNNWKKGEIDRYVGAAFRHFEAYRSGELLDEESGLTHLSHLLTNVAFLIELEQQKPR